MPLPEQINKMILIRHVELYNPDFMGKHDVLVAGGKIISVLPHIEELSSALADTIDASGMMMVPGFIDAHVHIAGAGGEGGPSTRTPEMQLSHMIEAGVTSVVGCLGTDGFTRSFESVLMKVKSLREQGVSAWMYAGAYQVPTPTLTGDVGRDLSLVDEVIGVGEIALSDHRSSHPTIDELIHLTAHARVGGMLGGKAGIINIHMGDAQNPFAPLYEVASRSELKLTQFLPTHCNRNHYIFEDAKQFGKKGYVDVTTSSYPYFADIEIKPSTAVKGFLEAGVPAAHITMTSDAFGSLPHFDEKGNLVRLEMGLLKSLYDEWVDLIKREKIAISTALQTITSNPARILKLRQKGQISAGKDADLLLIDPDFNLKSVMAMGQWMMQDGQVVRKGPYEK